MKVSLTLFYALSIGLFLGCAQGEVIMVSGVPFVSQAPYANWSDPVFREGCEEAAILMAMGWVQGKPTISDEEVAAGIKDLANFAEDKYGFYLDTSAEDTAQLLADYYDYDNIEVWAEITTGDIKRELRRGNIVLVPVNSQIVTNEFFTDPGPLRHMIVIYGYDPKMKEFISHEPGTQYGEGIRYKEDVVYAGLQDYPSGFGEARKEITKPMIVVSKEIFN